MPRWRPVVGASLALALLVMTASCRRAADDDRSASPSAASPSTASPSTGSLPADRTPNRSSGCGQPTLTGSSSRSLESAGGHRTYLLDAPAEPSTAPRPLLLDLHGLGSNAKKEAAYTHLGEKAAARGYVAITPDSTGIMWTIPPLPGVDDVTFIDDIIKTTASATCIDLGRVYLAGISNGAALTGALSCRLASQLAAAAMIAGPNAYKPCTDVEPIPLISFHGTDDPIIPYAGGALFAGVGGGRTRLGTRGQGEETPSTDPAGFGQDHAGGIASAEDALAGWAKRNGCGSGPTVTGVSEHVDLVAFTDCSRHADTQLYRVKGGGHTWPGAIAVGAALLGETTHEIDADTLVLDFFDHHAR